jgi:hypothetical protein
MAKKGFLWAGRGVSAGSARLHLSPCSNSESSRHLVPVEPSDSEAKPSRDRFSPLRFSSAKFLGYQLPRYRGPALEVGLGGDEKTHLFRCLKYLVLAVWVWHCIFVGLHVRQNTVLTYIVWAEHI